MEALVTAAKTAWKTLSGRVGDRRLARRIAALGASPPRWLAAAKDILRSGRPAADRIVGAVSPSLRAHLPIFLVGIVGLSISGAAFLTTREYYRTQSQQEFEGPAAQYAAIVSKAIDRYLEVINSIGTFMAAANEVDRWEFFGLAESNLPRYPGIRMLGWAPRVTAEHRKAYEKRAQTDGLYGFRISEHDAKGAPVAAGERGEYFPVYYVEPFEGNQAVLGFDLNSVSDGHEILAVARGSGQMIATRRVDLVQDSGQQASLLTVLPIYETGAVPATTNERNQGLVGFVLGVFRIGDMIEAALRELPTPAGLDIYVYDEGASSGDRLLHFHPSLLRRGRSGPVSEETVYEGLYSSTTYDMAGRPWSIVVTPILGGSDDAFNPVPWNVAAIGLLLTGLLLQYVISSRNRTRVIERSVAERTAQLVASNAALETEMHERIRAEEVRAELERELGHMQKMESLGTLAGGIAHEINTPVQYVAENLRFLSESFADVIKVLPKIGAEAGKGTEAVDLDFLRKEVPTSIDQSLEGIGRISEIVRAIKEFSHPDAKEKSAIDINHAIETTIAVARNQWKYVAEIETDFDTSLPPVRCLPGEFNQVILNLIVNAAQAIEETGTEQKGRITIATRKTGERVEIRVGDTGVGIPEEVQEKIFDPFYTTKEPGKGTGQGLAISYTIVTKKHAGTISVESEPGKGATFVVSMPLDLAGSSPAAA